jgi:hypothetical protein
MRKQLRYRPNGHPEVSTPPRANTKTKILTRKSIHYILLSISHNRSNPREPLRRSPISAMLLPYSFSISLVEYWSRLPVMWLEPFSQVWMGMAGAVNRDATRVFDARRGVVVKSHGDRFLVTVFSGQHGGAKRVDWGVSF